MYQNVRNNAEAAVVFAKAAQQDADVAITGAGLVISRCNSIREALEAADEVRLRC